MPRIQLRCKPFSGRVIRYWIFNKQKNYNSHIRKKTDLLVLFDLQFVFKKVYKFQQLRVAYAEFQKANQKPGNLKKRGKELIKQKSKVFIVDIQIKQSVLRVSILKFSALYSVKLHVYSVKVHVYSVKVHVYSVKVHVYSVKLYAGFLSCSVINVYRS